MTREDALASLMMQASEEGASIVTLRAMLEETTQIAADRVIVRLGLSDDGASGDLDELRELLQAWRDAKASAWKAFIEWIVRGVLAVLLIGISVRMGVWDFL